MSNLENITKKILNDAEVEAARIIQEAKKEVEEKKQQAEQKERVEAQRALEHAQAQLPQLEDRIRTASQREARDLVLQAKQSLLDRVFAKAKEVLENLSKEDYQKVVAQFLEGKTLPEEGYVEIPKGHAFLEGCKLPIHEVEDLHSGFRIISHGISDNYDFLQLLDAHRDEMEPRILQMLEEKVSL